MRLDTSFDFRTDAAGRDPDLFSPTLRRYHQLLWSRPLPSGFVLSLDTTTPYSYLHHRSELGEYWLSSDAVMPTFQGWISMQPIIAEISDHELEAFATAGYTMGGMMIFPGNRVDGKQTINGAKGFLRRIADRMDLTLECIRRHYLGQLSPLADTLTRYRDFFALFGNFDGYVRFFLLDDLVDDRYGAVEFFLPFNDFQLPSTPVNSAQYRNYRDLSMQFIESRNARIDALFGHE